MVSTGHGRWNAKEILNDSSNTITERGRTHGDYDVAMLRASELWAAYLRTKIEPTDVAICMALLKISRLMGADAVYDSWVDLCAYAAIAGELAVKDWEQFRTWNSMDVE
jgi:hypothetical protein